VLDSAGVTELTSGVSIAAATRPAEFRLDQNYPNPFNPKTVISGQWTADSWVRLVVYDLLGREVAVLANGRYPAGNYTFTFDGTNLASGVYLCRLTAGAHSAVKKMLLLR
ncbi:MAG TPA: T9SS type A sorting domain-containing protein, partial [Bacteroidota bacterium]|nr:T9SS type A sorting domain-containing protein [Bacteroidota bacterium]